MTNYRATLNYAARQRTEGQRPPPTEVVIRDARTAGLPGWQECGFELVEHTPNVNDWSDNDEIANVHYAEMEELARQLTGCDYALVSDHVRRSAQQAKAEREQNPVRLVHSDYAANYGDIVRHAYRDVKGRGAAALARNGITADDVENAGRIMMMQFWRNLGPPKMDYPLAFCDARSVTPDEGKPFRYTGYSAGGLTFDALSILTPDEPSRHAWYWFPELTPHEVIAFRTYDTELVREGRTHFTPHTAFRDPDVEVGNPPRTSIELRIVCLFK